MHELDFVCLTRESFARSRAEAQGSGVFPHLGQGEQRAVALVAGDWAWNLAGTAAQASPVALEQRQHDLWSTPHGILKVTATQQASARNLREDGVAKTALDFTVPGRFRARVILRDGMLAEVRRIIPGKPFHCVITSHHHYDHAGGLRTAAATGATLVLSELNSRDLGRVLSAANGLATITPAAPPKVLAVTSGWTHRHNRLSMEVHEIFKGYTPPAFCWPNCLKKKY